MHFKMILETKDWQEYHDNGKTWISGKIGIVAPMWKHLYSALFGVKGFEGLPVCRLGLWTKHYDNGQLAWTLDYGDGTIDYKTKEKFLQYRPDGNIVIY